MSSALAKPGSGDPITWGAITSANDPRLEEREDTSLQPFGDGEAMVSFEQSQLGIVINGVSINGVSADWDCFSDKQHERWVKGIEEEQERWRLAMED